MAVQINNKHHICFICESVLSIGGVQRVLATIAKVLCDVNDVTIISLLDNEDSDKTLYGLDTSQVKINFFKPQDQSGLNRIFLKIESCIYKIIRPKSKWASDIYANSSFPKNIQNQFVSRLNQDAFDIVIAVHGGLSMKLATIRERLTAQKCIGWLHNSYEAFFENEKPYYPNLKEHFKWQMMKLDNFIVLSKADKERYQKEMEISPVVIYNPLTLNPGKICNLNAKKFLSVGRMVPGHKGFDILIKAFSEFAIKDKEWTLDIVGEGSEEGALKSLISKYKLHDRVHLHRFTKNIQEYYSSASVYVLASRWEGFGLVLIEAMSHGLPIISSNLPAPKEILEGAMPLFFNSGDEKKLAQQLTCIAKESNISLLSNKSLMRSKYFSIDHILCQWNKLL